MPSERVQRQIDALLDEAEQAIRELDWETVLRRCQAVLMLDSQNEDAQTYLESAEKAGASANPSSLPLDKVTTPAAPTDDVPTSFASGRYEIKRFLGRGWQKEGLPRS